MSLENLYASRVEDGIKRWTASPGPAPAPPSFNLWSFLASGGKAPAAGAFDSAGSAADLISQFAAPAAATFGAMAGDQVDQAGVEQARQKMLSGKTFDPTAGDALRRKADTFAPNPETSSRADQVIHGLVRGVVKAGADVVTMGPVVGAAAFGLDEGNNAGQRLRMEGVDTATATKVGAVTGVASALGAAIPVAGSTLAKTAGLVAVSGPGTFMAQEELSRRILAEAGHKDLATLHDPTDPLGLALSIVPGAVFGGVHLRAQAKAAARAPTLADVAMQMESGGQRYGKDGQLLTSPKGAQGEMQVMPGTSADPGFGVAPARDSSPEELARVGRDYLAAMQTRYGSPDKALAAYNAGPGALDKAMAAHGADWLAHMPEETQKYVAKGARLLDDQTVAHAASDPDIIDAARVKVTNAALHQSLPDFPTAHAEVLRASDELAAGRMPDVTPAPTTALPEFRAWFGDSKIVDEAGAPLVMYHARQAGNGFDEFREGAPIFFASDRTAAGMGAVASGPLEHVQAYIRASNPANTAETPVHFLDVHKTFAKHPEADAVYVDDEASQGGRGRISIAVRDPKQIKSATGNSGKFDRNSASLTDPLLPGERNPLTGPDPWTIPPVPPHPAQRAGDLRGMGQMAYWAEQGGKLLRGPLEDGAGAEGPVTGRTRWLPAEKWFADMRSELGKGGLSKQSDIQAAIEKAIADQPLNARERATVDWIRNEAEAMRVGIRRYTGEHNDALASDGLQAGLSKADAGDLALTARAAEIDPSRVEDAARIHEDDDAAFMAEMRRIVGDEQASEHPSAGTGEGSARAREASAPAADAGRASNALPGPDEVGLAPPQASAVEPAAARSLDAQRVAALAEPATPGPQLLVKMPGSDETLTVAEALQRAKAEAKEDAGYADLVKAAADCALSFGA